MSKIFQFIDSVQLGGAEVVAFNVSEFCKHKYPDTFEFVVVELHQTDDAYSIAKKKELISKKIRLISLTKSSRKISILVGPFVLAYHLLKGKPDIIHSHTDIPDFVLSITKRMFSFFHFKFPKIVRTIHNTELWPTHYRLGKFTEAAFTDDWVAGVSAGSLESYKTLRNENNLSVSPHLQIIYNGCDFPKREEHPFRIVKGKINIAFCGRFEDQKGIDILIMRIKTVNSRIKDSFVFHIIGNGTYQNEVLRLSEENANVLLYDSVPNVANKLYAFDFIIIPSRFEGLGLISIEASFSKVPVIVAFANGLSETIPTHWPLQFNLEKEDELLAIFENIKNNKYDLELLKNEVYSYVSDKFSHTKMIDAYSNLFLEINE
jgi:glycosyltransferase involved in cell wall biosynthesis